MIDIRSRSLFGEHGLAKVKDVQVVVGQGRYALDDQRVPCVGMNVLVVKDGRFVLAP